MNVLISTYWNVNYKINFPAHVQKIVLISTYWNVNSSSTSSSTPVSGFNLNLLECKSKITNNTIIRRSVLISTYWNVNSKNQ